MYCAWQKRFSAENQWPLKSIRKNSWPLPHRRFIPIKKIALAALAGVAALTVGVGCKSISRGKHAFDRTQVDLTPVDGGSYVEASIGDASFLNPVLASDSVSGDINGLVYNGLVKYDKNIVLIGDLAENWDVKE